MKTIVFKPLRYIKKTKKVTVASYMQWRKVYTANKETTTIVFDSSFKDKPTNTLVYNHKGEPLFFYEVEKIKLPKLTYIQKFGRELEATKKKVDFSDYCISGFNEDNSIYFVTHYLDCDGVPTISHFTENCISGYSKEQKQKLEPLTVGMVMRWFDWFCLLVENSK